MAVDSGENLPNFSKVIRVRYGAPGKPWKMLKNNYQTPRYGASDTLVKPRSVPPSAGKHESEPTSNAKFGMNYSNTEFKKEKIRKRKMRKARKIWQREKTRPAPARGHEVAARGARRRPSAAHLVFG